MGATISSNIAKSLVQDSLSIANTYTQACTTTLGQQNGITVNNCKGKFDHVNFANTVVINQQCLSSANTTSAMQSSIATALAQKATAIGQSLGLGVTLTNNLVDATTTLAETVTNAYTNACASNITMSNKITCDNSTIDISYVNFQNSAQDYSNCIQQAITNSSAESNISQIINQSSFAKTENSFAILAIVGGIIVVALIITGGTLFKSPAIWVILIIIILVGIVSLIYAFEAQSRKLYPYPNS
jgi:hypothetical protein